MCSCLVELQINELNIRQATRLGVICRSAQTGQLACMRRRRREEISYQVEREVQLGDVDCASTAPGGRGSRERVLAPIHVKNHASLHQLVRDGSVEVISLQGEAIAGTNEPEHAVEASHVQVNKVPTIELAEGGDQRSEEFASQ